MRAKLLLVGGLALLLGVSPGCRGSKGGSPPPPLNKQLLTGKWKNVSEAQFIAGYEFADDGTMKTTLRGAEKPIAGRYTWSGDRTLQLEYPEAPDVRQAYEAAAKAYKKGVEDRIKSKELSDKAGPGMLAAVPDELPAKEVLRVSLAEKPRLLILTNESGTTQTFEKPD